MQKTSIDAVVFDLDGTLLNTLDDLGNAMNEVLKSRGYPTHAMADYKRFIGDGAARLVERALPPEVRERRRIDECLLDFRRCYGEMWNVESRPYEDIPELLDELAQRKIGTAVLSNKPHDFTIKCVARYFSRWSFAMVLGAGNGILPKPDPGGAMRILSGLNVASSRCIYLGDTGVDMQTAISAGMIPVGVSWGFRSNDELLANGARAVIHKPLDLLDVIPRQPECRSSMSLNKTR